MGVNMRDIAEKLFIAAQIFAYILAVIVIIQIIRAIFGGTWIVEDIMLAGIVLNIILTFGMLGYLINLSTQLNNGISKVDAKIHGHIEWHKGRDHQKI